MPADQRVGRQRGVLADWNDDRGFGFIVPTTGGSRVFAHVSAFPGGQRPVSGCEVTYAVVRDEHDRARASDVRYPVATPAERRAASATVFALAVATAFLVFLAGLVALGAAPVVLLGVYGVMSGAAFLMYGADKTAALRGSWRTSESTLHFVALLGGWPGALVARQFFRHKTIKQPFRTVFWVTVVANCGALAWFVSGAPVPA